MFHMKRKRYIHQIKKTAVASFSIVLCLLILNAPWAAQSESSAWNDEKPPYYYPSDMIVGGYTYADSCGTFHQMNVMAPLLTGGFVFARYGSRLVPQKEIDPIIDEEQKIPHHYWLVFIDGQGQVTTQHTIVGLPDQCTIEAITPAGDHFLLLVRLYLQDVWAVATVNTKGKGDIILQLSSDLYIQDAVPTPEGGWLLSGSQQFSNRRNAWAGLIGSDGSLKWTYVGEDTAKPFPEEYASNVYCWADENGLYLFGMTWLENNTHDYRFVKLSSGGTLLHETKLDYLEPEIVHHEGVFPVWGHNQLLLQLALEDTNKMVKWYLLCVDTFGKLLWCEEIQNSGIIVSVSKGYAVLGMEVRGQGSDRMLFERDFILMDTQGKILYQCPFGNGSALTNFNIVESADQTLWIFGELLNKRGFCAKLREGLWN